MTDLLNHTPELRQPERKSASHGEAGYERADRDFYPTEPWVTRALCRAVDFRHQIVRQPATGHWIWEPAVGDGRMADELRRQGYQVFGSDIHDYGWPGWKCLDFRNEDCSERPRPCVAIVTNPPFDLAIQFIMRAVELTEPARGKVAILQRHEFDAPAKNHPLFKPPYPFAAKLILHKRPRWSDEDKASPRFPYAWFCWDHRHQGPPILRYLPDPDRPAKAVGDLL